MKPFVLAHRVSQEVVTYFLTLFNQIPEEFATTTGYVKSEKHHQVTFKTGETFFVQMEEADMEMSTRLYTELGIDVSKFPPPRRIAAITSRGIIPLHNDFSKDETVLINVGLRGTDSTVTRFFYPDETVQLEYGSGQAFIFDPKINHEVAWKGQPLDDSFHRTSLTLKFFTSFDSLATMLC